MTVGWLRDGDAYCEWFNEDRALERHVFPIVSLKKVEDD